MSEAEVKAGKTPIEEMFELLLISGSIRIAGIIAEQGRAYGPDDTPTLPFRCWGCDEMREDFAMINGDGIPMCKRCMDRMNAGMFPGGDNQ